jgi:hypothetical protein
MLIMSASKSSPRRHSSCEQSSAEFRPRGRGAANDRKPAFLEFVLSKNGPVRVAHFATTGLLWGSLAGKSAF